MVEVLADLVHLELAVQARFRQGNADVLAVLAAAGVTGVDAGGEHQDPAVSGVVSVLQDGGDVGIPVAVAPKDGKLDAAVGQLSLDRGLQLPVLLVDGADATECAVVVRDLFQPLVRDAAATGDVAQEGNDVILAFGATEGRQQHGVVTRLASWRPRSVTAFGAVEQRGRSCENLGNLGSRDAAAGVEGDFFTNVVAGFGGAQVAHQVHQVHQFRCSSPRIHSQSPSAKEETVLEMTCGNSRPSRPWSRSILPRSSVGSRYHS